MEVKDTKERFFEIDCIRVIAILCVVLSHSVETNYTFTYAFMNQANIQTRVFAYILLTTGRLGVPLFLMISGFLLLDRAYDYKGSMKFYRNNLLGLFTTTAIWCVVYNFFLAYFYNKPFSMAVLIRNVFFVEKNEMRHMWYIPMILGIYLVLPLIANLLKCIEIKMLRIPMIISFIYLCIPPMINPFLKDIKLNHLPIFFKVYPLILIMGYLIKKGYFDKISSRNFLLLFFCSYILTVILQLSAIQYGKNYNVWYNCGLLLVASISLFLLLRRRITRKEQASERNAFHALITKLAHYSFGVFLTHMIFILVFDKYIQGALPFKTIVVFVLSVICSYVSVFLVGKIKILRRPLLYMK